MSHIAKFRCGQAVWAVMTNYVPTRSCKECKRPLNDSCKVEYKVERFVVDTVADVGIDPNVGHYQSRFEYTVDGRVRDFNEDSLFGSKREAVKRMKLMMASDNKAAERRKREAQK